MSNQLISMPVFVEDSGETMILKLSPQDAARATKDVNYTTSLIKNIYKKRKKNLINQESVQISIDNSDETDNSVIGQSSSSASCISSPESQNEECNVDHKDLRNGKSLFL